MGTAAGQGPDRARRRAERSQTRRQILDAAYTAFSQGGIAGTSLTEVAAAAGLTKGAIYSNFASKDDLVLALMEERVLHRLDSAVARFSELDDRREALVAVGELLVEAMRSDAGAHRLLAENYALSHRDPDRRQALRERRREAREAVGRALVHLQEVTGLQLRLGPQDTAVVLLALSNGLGIESDIDDDAVPDDLVGRILALLADRTPSRGDGPDRC